MSRRESVGRLQVASQSGSSEPTVRMVSVAVLPPRLPSGMAPPTGVGGAEVVSWDEALNWQHNNPAERQEPSRRKNLFRKVGMTTQRKRVGEDDDLPPFVMRQIPYGTWRKHYAKDKDGNFRGTSCPAEDCLLKPDDVRKWRLDDPVTKADRWTRGPEALPVYAEADAEGAAPDYQADVDERTRPTGREAVMRLEDDTLTEYFDARDSMQNTQSPTSAVPKGPSTVALSPADGQSRRTIVNGKTAAQIIEEAKAKPNPKMAWKEKFSKGTNMAMMGN